jgi:hypothetical protein
MYVLPILMLELTSILFALNGHQDPFNYLGLAFLSTSTKDKIGKGAAADRPSTVKDMKDYEFNQWLTGFTDGEGNFSIKINSSNTIQFYFGIKLHIDDIGVLEYIKNRLNCGLIAVEKNTAKYYLTRINDINDILIPLFEKFPLNGVKYLDYLSFKEGVSIKLNSSLSKDEQFKRISSLKNGMNTRRVNFEMGESHTIRITPYWLLGLTLFIYI